MHTLLLLALLAQAPSAPTRAGSAAGVTDPGALYEAGLRLFRDGDKAGALEEFEAAYALAPHPATLYMRAQCEYHLGRFKEARAHYQQYLAQAPTGPQADKIAREIAEQRIAAIDRRPSTFDIDSDPVQVNITLESLDRPGPPVVVRGEAPNDFEVPPGRYRITARKENYISELREESIDVVETRALFFALKPVPARLEVRTRPPGATLYVQGNRARNPYVQEVPSGSYEVYAEATDYEARSEMVKVAPGENKPYVLELRYVQRSGRPELIGFWTAAGAVVGATAVVARLRAGSGPSDAEAITATGAVVTGAALVGGVVGGLVSRTLAPDYIRDNLALFRIGAAWIGAIEGTSLALAIRPTLVSGFTGGVLGLSAGAVAGTLLDGRAPNYGRVAVIQSGAAIGALAGALAVPAFSLSPGRDTALAIFGGLNVGLGAGLALAYLPDQRVYGPTWRRVLLVDVATAAGALTGALVSTVRACLDTSNREKQCSFDSEPRSAQLALIGAGVGLITGWVLTRDYDRNYDAPSERTTSTTSFLPRMMLLPQQGRDGRVTLAPALGTQGRF